MSRVGLEDEIERADRIILAAEDWSKTYNKTPDIHVKLIKNEAKLQRLLRGYFRDLAKTRLDNYINWQLLKQKAQAYKFDVVVDVNEIDAEDGELMQVIHDPLQLSMALGAASAEDIYKIELGLNEYSDAIMNATTKYVGELVKGITQTTKDRIKAAVQQSINLHENLNDARARLENVVNDSYRAEMIARTETVTAFNKGISTFGEQSGATSKVWELSDDPCSICEANGGDGDVPFDESFSSGDDEPPAHPNAVFAGTTFIPYGDLKEMVSADYDGPAISIETSENNNILIGPNHPMLTVRGMIRASELTESDYLVYDTRINNMSTTNSNGDSKDIPEITNVFESLILQGAESLIATTSHDLHGDRIFCKGEINVIKTTNCLLTIANSCGIEKFRESGFVRTDMKSIIESSNGSSSFRLDSIDLSTPSSMSSTLSSFRFERIRFIHTVNYKGKAFDASTNTTLYNSNGFVVSNCRCGMSLIHDYGNNDNSTDNVDSEE